MKKNTIKKVLESFLKAHGCYYDYSLMGYTGVDTKIKIICPKHGTFYQTPYAHRKGHGCRECHKDKIKEVVKSRLNAFIYRSIKVHGNKYNYSQFIYEGTKIKGKIICPKHGVFIQKPEHHLRGHGCPKCCENGVNKPTSFYIDLFKKIHKNFYTYKIKEKRHCNVHKKIVVVCPKHGFFLCSIHNHKKGEGCPKCAREKTSLRQLSNFNLILNQFKQTHGDRYNYSKSIFKGVAHKIEIICPKHGYFFQCPDNHRKGHRCPRCMDSIGEKKISKYLKQFKIAFIPQHTFKDCVHKHQLHFDFYLPSYNMCIEFDGIHHFEPIHGLKSFNYVKTLDSIKNKYCINKGIILKRIPYTQPIVPELCKILGTGNKV